MTRRRTVVRPVSVAQVRLNVLHALLAKMLPTQLLDCRSLLPCVQHDPHHPPMPCHPFHHQAKLWGQDVAGSD